VGDASSEGAAGPVRLAPPPPGSTPPAVLRYFGDYELLEEIARGGMGIVYRARQVSLNRVVAVKVILAGPYASREFVQRFRTEAEAAANLQHPSIVAIHEVGEHEGQHYFSMDYVEGMSLAEWARRHPVSPTQAARLVKAVAEAVQYAHQRGTLHRDLKPQNVLMDASGRPRITDFGLAKQLHRESDLTLTGQVLGSPGYLPPEQAAGQHGQVGPPSDVYSLGAILYDLLTGQPPLVGSTPVETLRLVLDAEPAPPARVNPKTPPDLETICLKCLQKRPESRYATARDLVEELDRFLNHEPIQARPASAFSKAWRWARRHPWTIAGAASVVMLGLIGFAFGLWQLNRLLSWRLAHPGQPLPAGRHLIDSATSGAVVLYICLFIGVVPLEDLRLRKLRGGALTRRRVLGLGAFGVAEVILGIGLVLDWIRAYVWEFGHVWRWPQMALLAPFCLAWFGTILIWKAARAEQEPGVSDLLAPGQPDRGPLPLNYRRLVLLLLALEGLAFVWFADQRVDGPLYWKFVFSFCAVSCSLLVASGACWKSAQAELRPFWLFLTVATGCYAFELISKLSARWSGRTALEAALLGLLGGVLFGLARRNRP
jgi:predicted Ser/Thr protein kinase